jgi:S-adenosylmethionine uptake transporter
MPEPTVKVRMKESRHRAFVARLSCFALGHAKRERTDAVTHLIETHRGLLMGPLLMIGAGALFAGANVAVQAAGMHHGLPGPTIAFWQYVIACGMALPWAMRQGWRTDALGWHVLRVAMAATGVQLWVWGLAHVPIWQAIALILTSPLFVTLGARLFLGEALTPARVGAVVIGGIGGAIILAPWSETFRAAALLPLAAAAFWAGTSIITKHLSKREPAGVLTIYLLALLVPINGLFALGTGFAVPPQTLWIVLGAGLLTGLAQYLLAQAYCMADASLLQPFDHVKLPLNVGLGILVFGFVPPGSMWLGAAIIVAASLWLLRQEA